MKAFLYISTIIVKQIREWIVGEATNGYYTQGGNWRRAPALAADFLPDWVYDTYNNERNPSTLPAGGTVLDGGILYSSCAGNWMTLSNAGEIRIGGTRHGIVIANFIEEGFRWEYPVGGTMTPELAPWEHPTPERALQLQGVMKKKEIEALPPEIKEGVASLKTLKGTRLLRKQNWLKKGIGEGEYTRLFG